MSDHFCATHPDAPAIAACSACGRWCCAECRLVSAEGLAQCPECSVVQATPHHPPEAPAAELPTERPTARATAAEPTAAEIIAAGMFLDTPAAPPQVIPWEAGEGSDVVALRDTVWSGLSRPMQFSQRIPWSRGDLYPPLVFAVLCATFGHVARVLQLAFSSETVTLPNAPGLMALHDVPAFALGLLALPVFPLMFTALLFASAFLSHLFLDLAGASKRPFEATFRVIAYAHVGKVLLVVPLLGANVQVFYMVFLVLTGLRAAHGAGLSISVLALLPVVAVELMLG